MSIGGSPAAAPPKSTTPDSQIIKENNQALASVRIWDRAPVIGILPLSGTTVPHVDRHRPVSKFTCRNCKGIRENALCFGYAMNYKRKRITNEERYHYTWIVRGEFCSLSCANFFAQHNPCMHFHATVANTKLMAIKAYKYLGDIPATCAHSELPPFQVPRPTPASPITLTKNEAKKSSWSYAEHWKKLDVPVQAPDPKYHTFYDDRSDLLVHVDMDDLVKTTTLPFMEWYTQFKKDFPQFLYRSDYDAYEQKRAAEKKRLADEEAKKKPNEAGASSSSSSSSSSLSNNGSFDPRPYLEKLKSKATSLAEAKAAAKKSTTKGTRKVRIVNPPVQSSSASGLPVKTEPQPVSVSSTMVTEDLPNPMSALLNVPWAI